MRPASPEIRIVPGPDELCRAAAAECARVILQGVGARGRVTVALSGGSTPRRLYRLLADEAGELRLRLPWDRVHFFWGDERHVPPDHPDSNYRMAFQALLSRAPVPPENVHRIPAEDPDAGRAAQAYQQELREFFHLGPGEFPRLDLVLLGMGADGHTASLFPGTDAVRERARLVVAPWVEPFKAHRITLTPPVLNHAGHVLILVSGAEKAEALQAALQGPYQPERFPIQVVRPVEGQLLWLLDQAAARRIRPAGERERRPG